MTAEAASRAAAPPEGAAGPDRAVAGERVLDAATGAAAAATAGTAQVAVWDPVVRVFHWTFAAAFLLNHFVNKAGGTWHNRLGYLALALVAVRLAWGLVSPFRHARFADFLPSPRRLASHLRDVARGRDSRHVGHNPAGAAMIVALLTMMTLVGVTGWMQTTDRFWGVDWVQTAHAWLSDATLALVALHVAGALYESLRHRENLVLAMVTGRKRP